MQSVRPDKHPAAEARALEARIREALRQGQYDQAVADCRRLNEQFPEFAPGWHTASHLAIRAGRPRAALAAIERALAIDPERPAWLLQQALCVDRLGDLEAVSAIVERLGRLELNTAYEQSALGMLLTRLGRRDDALRHYQAAAQREPEQARHHYNVACMQRSLGHMQEAEASFDRAIELDPADYESWKIRAELRRQTPEKNHVAALEALLRQGIDSAKGEAQVCYALAKELEDLEAYDRAFEYLKRGADARRSTMRYDVDRDVGTLQLIRETFSAEVVQGAEDGSDNAEAIFILGLPRTGTTLVERMLASHSKVFAAGELNNFAIQMTRAVSALAGGRKLDRDELVRQSAGLDFRELGDAYIASTRPFTGTTPRFIDKMPLNYLYLGLIRLALPEARIISLERHPADTCYAIYKQLFVDAYPFSYDLGELGRYYVAYHELMHHWHAVLPGAIHTVRYESLVEDFESEARRIVEFCGLDWEEACLRFHENRSASMTASAAQVRQPVYRSSVGKWRHYREQLAPLLAVLEHAGIPLES